MVGAASTAAYVVLFALLRTGGVGAQAANLVALLVTVVANTAVNRRVTFAVTGSAGRVRHQLQGLVVFGAALALTSASLVALHAVSASPPRAVELGVLVTANLVATLMRFLLLRSWVFRAA